MPYSWETRKTADLWTLSMSDLSSKQNRHLRFSLAVLPRDYVCRETQDDVLSVLAWSFTALAKGEHPATRRNGLD